MNHTTRNAVPPSAAPPALELHDVRRTFHDGRGERVALDDITLTVRAGELVALMGPSGSGKSTLLHVSAGLDQADTGTIAVHGTHLHALDNAGLAQLRRRSVGFVEQHLNLLAALSAAENVALPLELDGRSAREAKVEAVAALDLVGLAAFADAFPDALSGGEQQRVAIARALVGGRSLLLADEPTGALDSRTGEAVMALLRARCDAGAAAVVATHNPAHAGWADRVVFLADGVIVDATSPPPADDDLSDLFVEVER